MQIRSRLTLQFSVLVSAILLTAFVLVYFFAYRFNKQEFQNRLRDKAITSATLLLRVAEVDLQLLRTIDRAKSDVLYGENITVYEGDKEIYTNNDTITFDVTPALLASVRKSRESFLTQGEFDLVGLVFRNQGHDYVVLAGAIDVRGKRELANLRTLLVVLFFVIVAIVVAAGYIYAGRALLPINNLIKEVQAISVQDLHQRVRERSHQDEIGKLIRIFNNLLARIEHAFDLQKSFVSNVSHELKNPLTKITSQLEVTLLKDRGTDEYKETVRSVLEDIRELNMLSGSLLDLASLHDRSFTMTKLRVDEVLWEALEDVRALDAQYQTEVLAVKLPEDAERLYMPANPYLLKTSFINVVENACKFSSDHTARVEFQCTDNEIKISVSDHGPGIDKKDIENIFQPFYRADRTSKIKGYGVGLSLCQRIVRIHKGTVTVASEPGQGARVTIVFPLVQPF